MRVLNDPSVPIILARVNGWDELQSAGRGCELGLVVSHAWNLWNSLLIVGLSSPYWWVLSGWRPWSDGSKVDLSGSLCSGAGLVKGPLGA